MTIDILHHCADQSRVCHCVCGIDALSSAQHHLQGADLHKGQGDAQGQAAGHFCGKKAFAGPCHAKCASGAALLIKSRCLPAAPLIIEKYLRTRKLLRCHEGVCCILRHDWLHCVGQFFWVSGPSGCGISAPTWACSA